jgi:uncharacterized protein GlcG (DUF336 family)
MRQVILFLCVAAAMALVSASGALAQTSNLPGDNGRMMDGILPTHLPPPPARAMPHSTTRAPSIQLALNAAQTIVNDCRQYALGVAVVNAKGAPILVYVPDGSDPSHGYTAIRKAFTAVTFNADTSKLVQRAQRDATFAAEVKANSNLMAFSGGLLVKARDEVVGAIGVSGAEPGGHDEECGLHGRDVIENQLK